MKSTSVQIQVAIETAAKAAQTASEAAIALAKTASETAAALAKAKADSDVNSAIMSTNISFIKQEIVEVKTSLKELTAKDGEYVLKEDFVFWRNILISGMLLSLTVASLMRLFVK